MQILSEIIETSDKMIDVLVESGFFEENPMIDSHNLKVNIQSRMQRKWEQENEMILTDAEFIDACNDELQRGISETLSDLVEKGAVNMSIGKGGDIYYSANPDFDINKLNED